MRYGAAVGERLSGNSRGSGRRQVIPPLAAWSTRRRLVYLWSRAVGVGGLPIAVVSAIAGPHMWNLGRIISAGMALVCLPATLASAFVRQPRPPDGDRAGRRRRVATIFAAGATAVFLALAAAWFAVGLLGWVGAIAPASVWAIQSVMGPAALVFAAMTLIGAALHTGEAAGRRGIGIADHLAGPGPLVCCLRLFAQAAAAAAGIMVTAAPFELVGSDVRAYLVAVFAIGTLVWLPLEIAHSPGKPADREGRPWRLFRSGAVVSATAVLIAVVVPGWAGPIAGGLLGQVGLFLAWAERSGAAGSRLGATA